MTVNFRSLAAISIVVTVAFTAMITSARDGTTHYRWLDNRGNPVHSDRPPPKGIDYEVVETGSSIVRQVKGNTGAVPPETTPRVGNRFETVDKNGTGFTKSTSQCQRAKENLAALNGGAEIKVRNSQGELRTLSSQEVTEEAEKANNAIRLHCEE